jgi:tripartite-type tricarboxylate transporter receptor subunit TctC
MSLRWSVAALLFSITASALAQEWPAGRPVVFIVPVPAGGPVDLVARLASQKLRESTGATVVVDNRPGANGVIAAQAVARATADGYTVLLGNSTTHGTNAFLVRNLPYDPLKDFTPIAGAANALEALVVHPSVPAKNVGELIEYAKRNPEKLAFGSSGTGSAYHLAGELFAALAGIKLTHVPYKGLAPSLTELMNGQTQLSFTSLSGALPNVRAGKLRMLAMVEDQRYKALPDVPIIAETVPAFRKPATWVGFFGPAAMPATLVTQMNRALDNAVNATDVAERLEKAGLLPLAGSAQDFGAMVRRDLEDYGKLIKSIGLQPE